MQERDLTGTTLGACELGEPIGRGGMATVYRAVQRSLGRTVAVKVLPPYFQHDPTFLERFRREAAAIARLEHPHILTVHDFGEERGIAYLILEYVSGGSLRDATAGRPLPLPLVATIVQQLAEALDYAHGQGIVHRDLKPSNVLLHAGPDGDALRRPWVKLADFGIAKLLGGESGLTDSGVGVGTPEYMSPEQAQGKPVDRRSDVYALGALTFELVTGRPPYAGETPISIVMQHLGAPVPSARTTSPQIPPAVDRVIQRALAKQPEDRYPTAGAFAEALAAAVAGQPSEPGRTPRRFGRRIFIASAAVAALALATGGVFLLSRTGTPTVRPLGPPIADRFRDISLPVRDRLGPPVEPPRSVRVVEQEFQRGSVLVLYDPSAVYVITGKGVGTWQRPLDRLPGLDWIGDRPPPPIVIRDQIVQNLPSVPETIGPPQPGTEIVPNAPFQRFQNGFMLGMRIPVSYVLLNDGGFLTLR
ncbi:MAG: hypothetical protein KatS3mg060_3262 [Dehalococcoidia bacterium]|jgi:hypothetical protein|nr:MAG: hypothetical protein KatS3mg060_3262 [Dehalococcoidia bacterium]